MEGKVPIAEGPVEVFVEVEDIRLEEIPPEKKLQGTFEASFDALIASGTRGIPTTGKEKYKDNTGDRKEERCGESSYKMPSGIYGMGEVAVFGLKGKVNEMPFQHEKDCHRPGGINEMDAFLGWVAGGGHLGVGLNFPAGSNLNNRMKQLCPYWATLLSSN